MQKSYSLLVVGCLVDGIVNVKQSKKAKMLPPWSVKQRKFVRDRTDNLKSYSAQTYVEFPNFPTISLRRHVCSADVLQASVAANGTADDLQGREAYHTQSDL